MNKKIFIISVMYLIFMFYLSSCILNSNDNSQNKYEMIFDRNTGILYEFDGKNINSVTDCCSDELYLFYSKDDKK